MRRAIFPGTFDPFTIGHASVVRRALTFIDEIVIGIGINENKNTHFPIEKREKMIRDYYRDEPRIKVQSYDCLTIDFAKEYRNAECGTWQASADDRCYSPAPLPADRATEVK